MGPRPLPFLARRGVIWVPGNLLKGVGPAPGDLVLLFWRQRKEDVSALFLGAATIAVPTRQWGQAPWLDTIPAKDPLYQEASRLGYGGPPNYMTMARLDASAKDSDSVHALFAGIRPGLRMEPGIRYRGIPPDIFLFPVDDFHLVVDSPPAVNLMDRIVVDPKILGKTRASRLANCRGACAWMDRGGYRRKRSSPTIRSSRWKISRRAPSTPAGW